MGRVKESGKAEELTCEAGMLSGATPCSTHFTRGVRPSYRIRGVAVRAVRCYCEPHAVELAGFRVFPVEDA